MEIIQIIVLIICLIECNDKYAICMLCSARKN